MAPIILKFLKMKRHAFGINLLFFILLPLLLTCSGNIEQGTSLHLVKTISIPNVKGRIDHLAINLRKQIIYIAALGNNTLEVVDLKSEKVIHTIKNLNEPQGVVYVPKNNSIFVSNGGNGECDVFD